jgi:hypothetical protein
VWYFGTVPTVWYFGTVPTVWYLTTHIDTFSRHRHDNSH